MTEYLRARTAALTGKWHLTTAESTRSLCGLPMAPHERAAVGNEYTPGEVCAICEQEAQ